MQATDDGEDNMDDGGLRLNFFFIYVTDKKLKYSLRFVILTTQTHEDEQGIGDAGNVLEVCYFYNF